MPRATTRGAIAVRTTHLISPSPRENKMEIANWVLPVFGIGGPLSNPLGSLLVALAGLRPSSSSRSPGLLGLRWELRYSTSQRRGGFGIATRVSRFQATVAHDLVDQRQHELTGTQVSTEASK